MFERIFADYFFYMGWSLGMTAFLMFLEPILLSNQHQAVVRRLKRLLRAKEAE